MRKVQKTLALLILPCLIISVFSPAVHAASYITSANGANYTNSPALASALNSIFNGDVDIYTNSGCTSEKSLPLGCDMNNSTEYWVKSKTSGNTISGWQCYIYGNAVYNKLFNEWVGHGAPFDHSVTVLSGGSTSVSYTMFKNAGVKCGAYMRTTTKSDGSYYGNGGHSMIILSYDSSYITYLNGNCDGEGKVAIQKQTWSDFNSNIYRMGSGRYLCHIVQPTDSYYDNLYPAAVPDTYATITEGVFYRIASTANIDKKYLSIAQGADVNSTEINGWTIVSSKNDQIIKIQKTTDGYKLLPQCSTTGKVVNVASSTVSSGINVTLYQDNNNATQWWKFVKVGSAYKIVSSANPSVCLTIDTASTGWYNINVQTYTGAANQLWTLEPCTYRIEYNLDGGSFASALNSTKEWDSESMGHIIQQVNPTITCLNGSYGTSNYHYFYVQKPTKSGYIFKGWDITGMDNYTHRYWDTTLGKNVDFTSTTITADAYDFYNLRSTDGLVTFTAKWESTHTHNYTETVTKKATCTTDGLKTFTCVCGDTYTETIKATGHKNTIFITELKPTCTEPGSEDEYCLDCSELVGTREIPALGHDDSGEWIVEKAATCTENGTKALYCKRCTEKIDTVSITALGHNFVLAEKNEKHPHNELYKCTRCLETKTVDSVYSEICPECNFTSTAIDAQSCKITGYTGELSSLTVPAELGGKKVVSTATSALKANAKLTEVRFEDGITEIGSLTFMNCSSLKKAVVPASVTTIGTYAFFGCAADFAIYCFRDSYAHQYAVDNDIDFVLMDIAETKNSVIDYTHKLIFTQFTMAADMSVLIGVPKNVVAIPQASVVNGNRETFGTGSTVTVFENNTFSGEYTVIVNGDLDGDGVSDVLDVALAERAANGRETLSDAQAYAANNSADTEIDAASYQNVVNRALGA